jgi:hypothetical protein
MIGDLILFSGVFIVFVIGAMLLLADVLLPGKRYGYSGNLTSKIFIVVTALFKALAIVGVIGLLLILCSATFHGYKTGNCEILADDYCPLWEVFRLYPWHIPLIFVLITASSLIYLYLGKEAGNENG